jgi:hypothetical protein
VLEEQASVNFPEWVNRRFRRRKTFPKRCYERAWQFVIDHADVPGVVLVHGRVTVTVPVHVTFGHAWVELPDGLIFDGVKQACYDRTTYLAELSAEVEQTYTPFEAAKLVTKTQCYGPWTQEGGLRWPFLAVLASRRE